MQNKGIVKFIAIALVLVCCFYLSFSFVTSHYESKIAKIAETQGQEAAQAYQDSVETNKVWLWAWNLKECREMEMGLGLDLKGGLNVIMEVSVPDIVDMLAAHKQDADYLKVLDMAKRRHFLRPVGKDRSQPPAARDFRYTAAAREGEQPDVEQRRAQGPEGRGGLGHRER